MLSKAQHNQRREAGRARAKSFTRAYQRMARSKRTKESLAAGGRKAFRTMVDSGRIGTVQQKISERNIKNASRHHELVRDWLNHHCFLPIRECVFLFPNRMFEVDFVVGMDFVIEVDGFRFKECPFGDKTRNRQAEFQAKLKELAKHGYKVFVFDTRRPQQELKRLERQLAKIKVSKKQAFEEMPF